MLRADTDRVTNDFYNQISRGFQGPNLAKFQDFFSALRTLFQTRFRTLLKEPNEAREQLNK